MKPSHNNNNTAALFNNSNLQSYFTFTHCSRIPDVMARVIKARSISKRYTLQTPLWTFYLEDNKDISTSYTPHLPLMSFVVSLRLYDRLFRFRGAPDFLIGNCRALSVSAKTSHFGKNVLQLFYGEISKKTVLRVYQKKPLKIPRFSLLHFSEKVKNRDLAQITKEYNITNLTFINPSSYNTRSKKSKTSCFIESFIEQDSQLSWFWPILKKNQKDLKYPSPTLDSSFI